MLAETQYVKFRLISSLVVAALPDDISYCRTHQTTVSIDNLSSARHSDSWFVDVDPYLPSSSLASAVQFVNSDSLPDCHDGRHRMHSTSHVRECCEL